ncbi:hypothetical protein, partial [Streptococcus mitis]|uniref:hypothetical protein n=1 Tax=Streptococcus mitis TaxID=28037 RepID=UPI001B80D7D8
FLIEAKSYMAWLRKSSSCYTLRKSLQITSALSATSKLCFEQPASSFLVCSLIFIEYKQPLSSSIGEFFDDSKHL